MDRRTFLHALAALGAGGVLSACGDGGDPAAAPATPTGPTTAGAGSPPPALTAVAPDADPSLTLIAATLEQLVGDDRPFAFGLITANNKPITETGVELYVVPDGAEPLGPFPATFQQAPVAGGGIHVAQLDLPTAGPSTFVAVTPDRARAGVTQLAVVTPETSAAPAPGGEAIAVPTPTVSDQLGYEQLCTADPPCGMHEVSLDEALAAGRPVVLTFATPAFCETAVCGPSVTVLDEVRTSRDWGDVAFIHVEVFSDAGQTVGEPVTAWNLPSEPWLFTIDAQGQIAGRADGPLLVLNEQVARLAEDVA